MNIRPKTIRRLVALVLVFALIASTAALMVFYSKRSKVVQAQGMRTAGVDAFNAGNYSLALEKLSGYLGKHQDDYDAMYAYASSRYQVETSGGRHLSEAKQLFEQLHSQRSDDMRVAHALLELYSRLGFAPEATAVADQILKHDPKDLVALSAKSAALERAGKLADALTVAIQLNDAAELDVQGHLRTMNLLRSLKKPPQEIVARYQQLQEAHPDDPRFELLLGCAFDSARDRDHELKWLRSAAARTPPDAAFVQRLSLQFDQLMLFDESQALIERAADSSEDPEILKVLVQRLWQNGRAQDVVDRLAKIDVLSPSADADLLALKAIALQQLDKRTEAAAIVAALKARTTDNNAAAWALALGVRYDGNVSGRDAIARYQAAISRNRDKAIIRLWIGETFWRLGESELATQQWKIAAKLLPSWAHPHVLLSRAALAGGHVQDALDWAGEAIRRAPQLVESAVAYANARYRYLQQNPDSAGSDRLASFIADIQRGMPGEPETLPILVALQARAGKHGEAVATIRAVLADEKKSNPELLLRLLEVSRDQSLGLGDEILAKLPDGPSISPAAALQRALESARNGRSTEGLDYLAKASAAAKDQQIQWKLALAQYREAINDLGARPAWVSLGDENPGDIAVQNLILKSARSAGVDREFIGRTIERLRALTGDEAVGWRLAKARWLLSSENKQTDGAEAVGILTELVRNAPEVPEYRVLLANGLLNLNNPKDAIDHLKAAVEADPRGVGTMLQLASLLQDQGKLEDARSYLNRAARSTDLTPDTRKTLATMLARQGAIPQAIDLLRPAADELDASGKLLLAELYRKRAMNGESEAIYTLLLNNPAVSAEALASAADFYASTNRLDQARPIITRLSDSRFAPTQRLQLIARFNEAYVSDEAARAQFAAATTEAPNDAEAWRGLIDFYIRGNRFEDAADAADRGLKNLPGNELLTALKSQSMALKATRTDPSDLRPLIEALGKDPKNAAQVEMLRAIQDARENKQSPAQLVAKLKAAADRYPSFYPLQLQLAQGYMALGQVNEAAMVAERLTDARPNDPDATKLAVGVYRSAARWRDMKRAADKWRQRSLDKPMDPDIALAEAMLQLDDAKGASDQVAPYIDQAVGAPLQNFSLTSIVAQIWVVDGKAREAQSLLQPSLSSGAEWRHLWLRLAGNVVTPRELAGEWIRAAEAIIADDATAEQLAIAQAWQQMGLRLADAQATDAAKQILRNIVNRPDAGTMPALLLASLEGDAGNSSVAEQLYRKVLKVDPNQPEALNNLAFILLENGGDLSEAKDMATRAVAAAPSVAAIHDTLARIHARLGDPAMAIKSFDQALRLEPSHLEARIGLAATLNAEGKRDQAEQELQRIDLQLQGQPPVRTETQRELTALRDSLSRLNND